MPYGQVIIGPPGSGKTTYCNSLKLFLDAIERPSVIVNLDPANENKPYEAGVDIEELITLEDVMDEFELGPNGGLVYCMEYLQKNVDWLLEKLREHENEYFIFDCPGQVELYSHSDCVRNIFQTLEKEGFKCVCLYLLDSYYISSPSLFISASLLALSTMVNLEMPSLNILSKIDLVEKLGKPVFDLEYYTSLHSLKALLPFLQGGSMESATQEELEEQRNREIETQKYFPDDAEFNDDDEFDDEAYYEQSLTEEEKNSFSYKFRKLNRALCDLFDDFGFVSYLTLNINESESIARVVDQADKANGYSLLQYISNDPKNILGKDGNIKNLLAKQDTNYDQYIDDLNIKYLSNYKNEEEEEEENSDNGFI
ncbi:hypothetical protein WA158_000758 [Blastocystis sp. Blastoise]